jgi:hypothetical protein
MHPTKNVSIGIDPYPYKHIVVAHPSGSKQRDSFGNFWKTSPHSQPPIQTLRFTAMNMALWPKFKVTSSDSGDSS